MSENLGWSLFIMEKKQSKEGYDIVDITSIQKNIAPPWAFIMFMTLKDEDNEKASSWYHIHYPLQAGGTSWSTW